MHKYQSVLHVLLYFGYQMYAVHKKLLEQVFGNVAFIPKKLSEDALVKVHGFKRLSFVYVSGSKYKIQDFAFIVDYQMQFETIEPADRALSFPGDPFKSTVLLFSLDMTAAKWRGANE